MQVIDLIVRLVLGAFNAYNRKCKKEAADKPTESIANGGSVQHSDKTFADLSSKPDSD